MDAEPYYLGDNLAQTFNFNGTPLRAIVFDGEPWFIALDVANALEYSDAYEMTKRLDADEVQNRQIAGFGNRGVNTISEPGLYEAIFNSRKPEAKEYKHWVKNKVLPAIRKTGAYSTNPQLPQSYSAALRELASTVEAKERLQIENARMKPIVKEYDEFMGAHGSVSVGDAAKLLNRAGIVTGEKRLFAFLDGDAHWTSRNKLTRKRRIMQTAVEQGLLEYKAQSYEHPKTGERIVSEPQIRVTPKGLHKLRAMLLPPMDIELLEIA